MSLVQAAVGDLAESDDDVEPGWRRSALNHFAAVISPDMTQDLARTDFIRQMRDPNASAKIASLLPSVASSLTTLSTHVEKLFRETAQ